MANAVHPDARRPDAGNFGAEFQSRRKIRFEAMKLESRRKLVAAARKLFAERGYHEVGPTDITQLAGVGVGTFYFYFENKLDCFLAFVGEAAEELRDFAADYYQDNADYPETLSAMLNALCDYSIVNPGVLKVLWEDVSVLSNSTGKVNTPQASDEFLRRLGKWKQNGEITSDIDSQLLSNLIAGSMRQGVALATHNLKNRDRIAEKITRFLIRATAPAPTLSEDFDLLRERIAVRRASLQMDDTPSLSAATGNGINLLSGKSETFYKLLTSAKELFAVRGYNEMGPEDIARHAGVSAATFYLYFEDKFDCFLALTNNATEEMDALNQQYCLDATTFPENVFAVLNGTFDYSAANPGVLKAMLANVRVLSKNDKRVCRAVPSTTRQMEQWQGMGGISKEFDSELLTFLIAGIIKHGEAFMLQNPDRRDEAIEAMARFMVRGMSADTPD